MITLIFQPFLFHLKKNPFLAVKTGSGQIVVYEVSIGAGGSPRCQLARLDGAPTVRPSHYVATGTWSRWGRYFDDDGNDDENVLSPPSLTSHLSILVFIKEFQLLPKHGFRMDIQKQVDFSTWQSMPGKNGPSLNKWFIIDYILSTQIYVHQLSISQRCCIQTY